MFNSVRFGGFRQWLPLDFEMEPVGQAQAIEERFADDGTPPAARAELARLLADLVPHLAESRQPGMVPLGAWALLDDDGRRLTPITVATASLMGTEQGITASEFVDALVEGAPLHQPIKLDEIETGIGTATHARGRLAFESDQGTDITEIQTIFWLHPDGDAAMLLQVEPMGDLILAGTVAQAMAELAASVQPAGIA